MKELRINIAGEFVRVRLTREGRPDKEQIMPFNFALSEQEQKLLQWYWEESGSFSPGAGKESEDADALLEITSRRLTNVLLQEPVAKDCYLEVADDPGNSRIRIDADVHSRGLPWELLRHEERWLAQEIELVRCPSSSGDSASHASDLIASLNILHICTPSAAPFQSVARHLLEVFRPHQKFLKLRSLHPANFARLKRILEAEDEYFHVVHVECAKPGQLIPPGKREAGAVQPIDFVQLLQQHQIGVVALSAACPGLADSLEQMASQLIESGLPAVVLQPFLVDPHTATQQWGTLYKALFNGSSLGEAVLAARGSSSSVRATAFGEKSVNDWSCLRLHEQMPVSLSQNRVENRLKLEVEPAVGAQAPARVEGGLPLTPDHGFIARDAEVLLLIEAFHRWPVVLMHAIPGTGKTTLSAGVMRYWAETKGPGLCLYFSFARYIPLRQICDRIGHVFGKLLDAQGVSWSLLRPSEQRKVAGQLLRQSACLMIWDDFERLSQEGSPYSDDERAQLKEFIESLEGGAARLLLVTTNIEPWLGEVQRFKLEGLDSRSVELMLRAWLLEKSIPAPEHDDVPQLQEFLAHLGHSPLALRCTSALLAHGLNPGKLHATLQAFTENIITMNPDLGAQAFVMASLQFGLARFDPDLCQRLIALSYFQGFVDVDVLTFLSEGELAPGFLSGRVEEQWQSDLDALTELGLAGKVGPGMCSLSASITWFTKGTQKALYDACRETLEAAFTDTYGQLGLFYEKRFHDNPEVVRTLLLREESNFRHALWLALRSRKWKAILGMLKSLHLFMRDDRRFSEWFRLIEQLAVIVSSADGGPLPGTELLWDTVLHFQAQNDEERGEIEKAEAIYLLLKNRYELLAGNWQEDVPTTDDQKENLQKLADTTHKLGEIAIARSDLKEGDLRYLQALVMCETLGDIAGKASAMHQLGRICLLRDDLEESNRWYQQSLPVWDILDKKKEKALTLHELGLLAIKRGEWPEAELWFRQVLSNWQTIGDGPRVAETLHQLGVVAEGQEQLKEAEEWYRKAYERWSEYEERTGKLLTLHHFAKILRVRGKLEEAEEHLRRLLPEWIRRSEDEYKADVQYQLGLIHEKRKEFREARGMLSAAEEIFVRLADPRASEVSDSLKRLGNLGKTRYMRKDH